MNRWPEKRQGEKRRRVARDEVVGFARPQPRRRRCAVNGLFLRLMCRLLSPVIDSAVTTTKRRLLTRFLFYLVPIVAASTHWFYNRFETPRASWFLTRMVSPDVDFACKHHEFLSTKIVKCGNNLKFFFRVTTVWLIDVLVYFYFLIILVGRNTIGLTEAIANAIFYTYIRFQNLIIVVN